MKTKNKIAVVFITLISAWALDSLFNYLIVSKTTKLTKSNEVNKIIYETSIDKNKSIVFLYPGFITKMNGRIFWHSQKPLFLEEHKDWDYSKAVNVTGCIYDPWPFTNGDSNLVLEISN